MSAPTPPTGWDLVTAAQQGDREAFGQLYGRYAPGVSQYVGRRVPDRHLAQDFTGETFARALRRLDAVSDQGRDVGAWFTRIAHNLLVDHWKSHRHQRETTVAAVPDSMARQAGPEETVLARETARELHAAIGRLTPAQQQVIRARYLEELPVAQVAAITGRNEGAVKALAHRGLEALRVDMTTTREPVERGTADPLTRARQAVAEVSRRVAAQQQLRAGEQAQVATLAHLHTTNHVGGQDHDCDRDAAGVAS